MKYRRAFTQALTRLSPRLQDRGRVIRKFSNKLGLVYFGTVHQHEDDHSAIRGFSASLTHRDLHYAVGTYEGFDIRLVNRLDVLQLPNKQNHHQVWTILEVDLSVSDVPHVFFVPTGVNGKEYTRLFVSQPYLQPLNTSLYTENRSREFHGRYQMLARTTYSHQIEKLFDSPTIVGIGARLWPHGVEIQHSKLYVYITDEKLTQTGLETTLRSALWLASIINQTDE